MKNHILFRLKNIPYEMYVGFLVVGLCSGVRLAEESEESLW